MSSPLRVIHKHLLNLKEDSASCLICKKPLGAESKEQGFLLCHSHRKCSKCSLDLSVAEVKLCLTRFLELQDSESEEPISYETLEVEHARCSEPSKDPLRFLKQSEYDYINIVRLMLDPDTTLNIESNEQIAANACSRFILGMTFEQKSLWLKKMEACTAEASYLVRQDPSYNKNYLNEREKARFDSAKTQAATSSRPVGKSSVDNEEVQLAAFVELRGLDPKNRTQNLKNLKLRNRAVKNLIDKLHITEQAAIEMCEQFKKQS